MSRTVRETMDTPRRSRVPLHMTGKLAAGCSSELTTHKKSLAKTPLLIQRKLSVSRPDDRYEEEADRVVDQVMRAPDSRLRRVSISSVDPAATQVDAPLIVGEVLKSPGRPLESGTRAFMESRLGYDFSRVRVHDDARAAESARAIDALAYTVGNDLVFNSGQLQSATAEGERLIGHELVHVLQQNSSEGRVLQRRGAGTEIVNIEGLPVASFSPSHGIFVDRTGNSVSISGRMEISGALATRSMANTIQRTINNLWTASFPNGVSIRCNVAVSYRGAGSDASEGATQIEIDRISGPSHQTWGPSWGRYIVLNLNGADALTWTVAHEFGHILGMQDRYIEGILSRIAGIFGGARSTSAMPGYAGNIMAESGGILEGKNVRDVLAENQPGFFTSDDQIRDWVSRHNQADIRALSTSVKIQMINTLIGGFFSWISDADVETIGAIMRAVATHAEAVAIRAAINPRILEFSDLGQRTRVRLFMMRMP